MTDRFYRITLRTPLGLRSGTMFFHHDSGNVNGWLSVMGQKVPFDGVLLPDGVCQLMGQLITTVRTIPYHAEGKVSDACLNLVLQSTRDHLTLTGTAFVPKEEELK